MWGEPLGGGSESGDRSDGRVNVGHVWTEVPEEGGSLKTEEEESVITWVVERMEVRASDPVVGLVESASSR